MDILQRAFEKITRSRCSYLIAGTVRAVMGVALVLLLTGCASGPFGNPFSAGGALGRDGFFRSIAASGDDPAGSRIHSDIPGIRQQMPSLDPEDLVAAHEAVLVGIYEQVTPSVVQIRAVTRLGVPRNPSAFGTAPFNFQRSSGSGFVWDGQGHIVTNHHVVEGADRVTVVFADRTELEADVLGTDPDSDLAVLKVDAEEYPVAPVTLGDSAAVRSGQVASAIGNPFGQEFTITSGIVSAVGRTIRSGNSPFSIPRVIQTDAPMNPGNSGGPLLDRKGRVIGVNTQIASSTGSYSGIGFAVPINTAKRVIPQLIETGEYQYSWLGISGASLSGDYAELNGLPRDTQGALVIEVSAGSPADLGGLQGSYTTSELEGLDYGVGGDVIVAINDTPIEHMDQLIAYLMEETRPDEQVAIEVIRDGERETLKVTLGTRPNS